jgi:hypothetical protein
MAALVLSGHYEKATAPAKSPHHNLPFAQSPNH